MYSPGPRRKRSCGESWGREGVWRSAFGVRRFGRDGVVGRESRRGQRQPPCWLNRAGFEPWGWRRAVQLGAFSGPSELRGVVRPRRGSNPARIRVIWMVHQGRAEIFALPFAICPHATRHTPNAKRRTPNAKRQTSNTFPPRPFPQRTLH